MIRFINIFFIILLFSPFVFSESSIKRKYNAQVSYSEELNILFLNNSMRFDYNKSLSKKSEFFLSYDVNLLVVNNDKYEEGNSKKYRSIDLQRTVIKDKNEKISEYLEHNIDRFSFARTFPNFDLYVGRQVIGLGSGRNVNPTDLFTPSDFFLVDSEEKSGIDGIRLKVPYGDMGGFDIGWILGKDLKVLNSLQYFKYLNSLGKLDYFFVIENFSDNVLYGVDLQSSIADVGVWAEMALINLGRYKNIYTLIIGAEIFINDFTLFVEYYRNSDGEIDSKKYLKNLSKKSYIDGVVRFASKNYLIPAVSWKIHPLLGASISSFINCDDRSVLLSYNFEYNLKESEYITFGGFSGIGSEKSELKESGTFIYTSYKLYF